MKTSLQLIGLVLLALFSPCEAVEVTAERDVCYGEADRQRLLLDAFHPTEAAVGARPAVIFIHGGGWSMGRKEDFGDLAMKLAKMGYATFSIDYRLVSGRRNCWPAQLDDAQRAVRWVRANATKYNLDPARIGAFGHSAGGHLAAFLGTRETRNNADPALAKYSSRVNCVIDLSGPSDLVLDKTAKGYGAVQALLGSSLFGLSRAARDASPIYSVDAKSAPCLIIHGRLDDLVPVDQAELLYAALQKAGVESKLIVFDDEGHGLSKQENAVRLIFEASNFLNKHLAAGE